MQGIEIHYVIFDVDIWCDCGTKFNMKGTDEHDILCPKCGAGYNMIPARVDGE